MLAGERHDLIGLGVLVVEAGHADAKARGAVAQARGAVAQAKGQAPLAAGGPGKEPAGESTRTPMF